MTQDTLPLALEPGVVAKDLTLWDASNPDSVVSLVPPKLGERFRLAFEKRPDLFGLDEKALKKKLMAEESTPNLTECRLRIAFWMEYDRAHSSGRRIYLNLVYGGICLAETFHAFMGFPEKVAWLLNPPATYAKKMEEALDYGLEQLREILDLPNTDSKGRLNPKLMELKAKIVEMMDRRVKGSVVQRVEQKNMNLHIGTTDKQVAHAMLGTSMEEVEKRIKELERRDRTAAKAIEAQSTRLGDETDE
jgi:hypothetical protein